MFLWKFIFILAFFIDDFEKISGMSLASISDWMLLYFLPILFEKVMFLNCSYLSSITKAINMIAGCEGYLWLSVFG